MSLPAEIRPGAFYVAQLRRALREMAAEAPVSGGQQISIRLPPHTLRRLELIAATSGWTRTQVILALVQHAVEEL